MKQWILCITLITSCTAQNTGDIRLFNGNDNSGIVQLYHNGAWKSVCGWNFRDTEAAAACRQLGFLQGEPLPLGAYGEQAGLISYPGVLNKCSTGQETSLLDCEFDSDTVCSQDNVAYASVNCFNTTAQPPAVNIRLESNSMGEPGYFTGVQVYGSGMWGRVCSMFWDDNDSNVVCRQLGYYGGKATYQEGDSTVPFLLSEINCIGNESAIANCPQKTVFCYNDRSAAVICYNNQNQGPSFSLVGGHHGNYGKLVVSIDGRQGLLCNASYSGSTSTELSYREANVLCRTMGFTSGSILNNVIETPGIDTVVLEGISCEGDEESIYECTTPGWKVTSDQCQGQQAGVVLYCYNTTRLASGSNVDTEKYQMGRVLLRESDTWYSVCGDVFEETAAAVVCRDLGFSSAVLLTPDSFGNQYSSAKTYVNSLACTGTEASLGECQYTIGRCKDYDHHAALLCKTSDASDNVQMRMSGSYFGEIIVTMYGVEGTVCMAGWDNGEADVVCKAAGFVSGIVLAGRKYQPRFKPLWAFNFECMGGETKLEECAYETAFRTSDWTCAENTVSAGVLCFSAPPPDKLVRLQDGVSDIEGRAEVYGETGVWGTICNTGWTISDAQVFCRTLGYPDGQPLRLQGSAVGGSVPIYLSNLQCDGTERSIFHCANSGWSSSCFDQTRNAGVYCYKPVDLKQTDAYGAVLYHDGDAYGLVCADGFNDNSAKVVCKELEFPYSLRQSGNLAFGPLSEKFTMSNLQCSGQENSITECFSQTEEPTCPSGQYAAVVCSEYSFGFSSIKANPIVEISYFLHTGYVCTEGFTDNDAKVMCKDKGNSLGFAYKTSATGYENNIRWLNGLGCSGTENSFSKCGSTHDWGNIGVCRWDALAAVICTDNTADLDFNIRLASGTVTTGRLEVHIKSTWGSVCGNDLTKSEAVVVCRQLGYHDGITMEPGHYGQGSGDILLSGFKCYGNESTIKDCVWSGYGQTSQLCDHSKDAAIFCYSKVRLTGSTTVNYGRLEVFDNDENDWLAVCDRNQAVNSAVVLCRMLGYTTGMFQRGSALGPTTVKIGIETITCTSQTDCTFSKGVCQTDNYVALYCSDSTIVNEDVSIRLPLNSFYGPVSIQRFGLWGHVCSVGFHDDDAKVVCLELGYSSGKALRTYATPGHPIIQGNVRCLGTETAFKDCSRNLFSEYPGCYNEDTVAAVMCYNQGEVTYGETDVNRELGEMRTYAEVKANSQTLRVDMAKFENNNAAVYCKTLDYAGGEAFRRGYGSYGISEVSCTGTESSILQCPGVWDPSKTKDQVGDLAGVICYTSVRLEGGDPARYGAVITSKGVNSGPVCAAGFDTTDADVACRNLNYESSLVLCCNPFGSLDNPGILTNVRCSGTEKQFSDCVHDDVSPEQAEACKKDYAAVACYNGQKPTAYSLRLGGDSSYTGSLVLRYLNIDGSVCIDGWDDNDAYVACRQLGFKRGVAYRATRSDSPAPFWTSQVECNGTETKLSDCLMTELGTVTGCNNALSHAGVICYNDDGIFYRLGGSAENRYGRVEVSLQGEWRSLCNLYWENTDSHVLCKMLGFRTGDAFRGPLRDSLRGPVWEANFLCNGDEATLYDCSSTGWRVSTIPACALHQNDAAAFCYKSVKLSTGVGRETDHGAVLFYYNDRWNTLCNKGFTHTSAKVVCRELGFVDGQVQVGTSYGALTEYPRLSTHTVKCSGDETDVTDCLVQESCDAQDYVSVVCYGFTLTTTEKATQAPPEEDKFDAVPIIVAVVLFVALLAVAMIAVYCYRKHQKKKKEERSKETFDNDIIHENVDGSVHVVNRLHGNVNTPELNRVRYGNREDDGVVDLERSYNNPVFRGDGSTTNSTYDRIPEGSYSNLRPNMGDTHKYDNLPGNQAENAREKETNSEDVDKDNRASASYFISPFAAQGVVESPTDNVGAPQW